MAGKGWMIPVGIIVGIIYWSFLGSIFLKDEELVNSTEASSPQQETKEETKALPVISLKERLQNEIKGIDKFNGSEYRESITNIYIELAMFNVLASYVHQAQTDTSEEVKTLGKKLESKVSAIQKKEFPAMRAAYTKIIHQKMWENDWEIRSYNKKHDVIEFISAIFVTNKNIAEAQRTQSENLRILRFKQSRYKWYDGADEYTYYNMDPLPDGAVEEIIVNE